MKRTWMIPDRCKRKQTRTKGGKYAYKTEKPRKRESCVDQALTRLVRKSGGSKKAATAGSSPRGSRSSGVEARGNHAKDNAEKQREGHK